MKKILSLEELKKNSINPSVVALGTFDGIHLGHCDVICAAKDYGKKHNLLVAVFTFSNHPLSKILPEKVPPILISQEEKEKIFEKAGVDLLISIPFTEELAKVSPYDFLELLAKINTKTIVVGENYSYGFMGQGDTKSLKKDAPSLNMNVLTRKLVYVDKMIVSSTNIRRLIHDGDISIVNKMLGRPYSIEGKVSHGEQRGRQIDFPTANLDLKTGLFAVPKNGVYAGYVLYENFKYKALINIGNNPTFNEDVLRLEAHILDFDGDLYGKFIKVELSCFIRPEIKFSSIEKLKEQIILDKEKILELL